MEFAGRGPIKGSSSELMLPTGSARPRSYLLAITLVAVVSRLISASAHWEFPNARERPGLD
jgi:hypothetical protein